MNECRAIRNAVTYAVLVDRRKRLDVWPPEFLALVGALRGDIPRPQQEPPSPARELWLPIPPKGQVRWISARGASRSLGACASELKGDIVFVTKGRRVVAALVPLENADRESLVLGSHPEFLEIIRRARAEIAAGRTLSLAEVKARVLRKHPSRKRARRPARG